MENLDVIKPEALIKLAEDKGRDFKPIKTNQIRNFFSAVISIKNEVLTMESFDYSKIQTNLILLKPKLAYSAGRQPVIKPFKEFMDQAIDAVQNSNDKEKAITNFFNLLESVVAYHKFYGGKDN